MSDKRLARLTRWGFGLRFGSVVFFVAWTVAAFFLAAMPFGWLAYLAFYAPGFGFMLALDRLGSSMTDEVQAEWARRKFDAMLYNALIRDILAMEAADA